MGNSTSTSGTSASTLTSTVHGRLSGSLLGSSADSDSAGREPPSNVTSENREAAPIQPQTIDEKEGVAEKEEKNESRENNSRSSTDKPAAEQSPDQPSKEALEVLVFLKSLSFLLLQVGKEPLLGKGVCFKGQSLCNARIDGEKCLYVGRRGDGVLKKSGSLRGGFSKDQKVKTGES